MRRQGCRAPRKSCPGWTGLVFPGPEALGMSHHVFIHVTVHYVLEGGKPVINKRRVSRIGPRDGVREYDSG